MVTSSQGLWSPKISQMLKKTPLKSKKGVGAGIISHDLFKAIVMEHSYERGVQKHHKEISKDVIKFYCLKM